LDSNIDEVNNVDCLNIITNLRQVVNTVNTFTDANECIIFVNVIKIEQMFIITSTALDLTRVPLVHAWYASG
jgi:hypothetical protein